MIKIQGFGAEKFMSEAIYQPEIYSDDVLSEAGWEEYGQDMVLSAKTKDVYLNRAGQCISGRYCAYTIETFDGKFSLDTGIRGESQAVIVFSDTGRGYVFS